MKCVCACMLACMHACVRASIKQDVEYLFHSFVNEVIMRCFVYAYGKHCNMVRPMFTPVTHIIKMLSLRKRMHSGGQRSPYNITAYVRLYLLYMHACILMIYCFDVVCLLVPYTVRRRSHCRPG